MTVLVHELKMNLKNFLIWFLSIAALCGGCIFLFPVVKDSMKEMSDSYANMGGFSAAFGLDKLSLATIEGFFATEIGTMYALGAAMYAALLGIGMFSKEEVWHTSEFLHTLPLGRNSIITSKLGAGVILLTFFDLLNFLIFLFSFIGIGEKVDIKPIAVYMLVQYIMHLEVAVICFAISALSKRNQSGAGLGLVLILYMLDLISRITDKMEKLKYATPFYYSNSSDIIGNAGEVNGSLLLIAGLMITLCIAAVYTVYGRRDLAA
ncbi:ABC transporter permease subunit [Anaerocolumna sp. AGMB13025]|uniref:ABC transporter permease subunit n=1 Tax=Anaerocolumna sp. AGMB13025 TaxID=3039116 RepID=UPI00241D746D|nr:ABC transporter permease subunit [Anaerocolumna sp. AGMB13025]WFR57980.1 ABC transporter permease subunit [Anaerocolumna sp. AGMB13025]